MFRKLLKQALHQYIENRYLHLTLHVIFNDVKREKYNFQILEMYVFNNVKRDKYNFQIFAIWYWRDVFRQYCWKIDFNVIKLNEFNCLFCKKGDFIT